MEQQQLRESQQRERERQEQRARDRSEGRDGNTTKDDKKDDDASVSATTSACVAGLLLAQGTSHYKTMARQVTPHDDPPSDHPVYISVYLMYLYRHVEYTGRGPSVLSTRARPLGMSCNL